MKRMKKGFYLGPAGQLTWIERSENGWYDRIIIGVDYRKNRPQAILYYSMDWIHYEMFKGWEYLGR